jgi:hypothetical protein
MGFPDFRGLRRGALRCFAGVAERPFAMLGRVLLLFQAPLLVSPLLVSPLYSADAAGARFVDVTTEAGIAFRHVSSATSRKYLVETVSGGVGFLDFDNDGWLDIYCVNGAKLTDPQPDSVAPDKTDPKFWNRLYRNNHDGTFADVTEKAGLRGKGYGMGMAAADYDNDGFTDLLLTTYGGAYLYHNNGDGTFTDVTDKAGLAAPGWHTSAVWFDYDNDGRLDLFLCSFVEFSAGMNIDCGTRRRSRRPGPTGEVRSSRD